MSRAPDLAAEATLGGALAAAAQVLAAAGIESPRREARLLVALAAEVETATILGYPERSLAAAAQRRLAAFLQRRAAHEPLSRILGRREFWSLDFALSPDTLDPRPDSETVVAAVLDHIADRTAPLRLLDFGTGTGCLLLALLAELPRAVGFGIDILPGAARLARQNAAALGLESRSSFAVGHWDAALVGEMDVIFANPPYIASRDLQNLPPEVGCCDPRVALDGGADGLSAYRVLAPAARRLLSPGGMAAFEVGAGQAADVAGLVTAVGLKVEEVRRDLAGIERCVVATAP